jgi:hypothetical protein
MTLSRAGSWVRPDKAIRRQSVLALARTDSDSSIFAIISGRRITDRNRFRSE